MFDISSSGMLAQLIYVSNCSKRKLPMRGRYLKEPLHFDLMKWRPSLLRPALDSSKSNSREYSNLLYPNPHGGHEQVVKLLLNKGAGIDVERSKMYLPGRTKL